VTLEEATKAIEHQMTVVLCDPAARAPNGVPFVCLVSGGNREPGPAGTPMKAFFTAEEDAVASWLHSAWDYAETVPGANIVYWRNKPEMRQAEFIPVDQIGMMNDPEQRANVALRLFYVYSRLVIAKE